MNILSYSIRELAFLFCLQHSVMDMICDFRGTIEYLKTKEKILLLTTSTRPDDDIPKSSLIADIIYQRFPNNSFILNLSKMVIYPCEGYVSYKDGNICGSKDCTLHDRYKNPTGFHRCWASLDHPDDELWAVSQSIFEADTIIFFGSVRWGCANSIYQKVIERLTWIENRHTALGEDNIIAGKDAGLIFCGQNWMVNEVINHQRNVLTYFGFNLPCELSWGWQFTDNDDDESLVSYLQAIEKFNTDIKSL